MPLPATLPALLPTGGVPGGITLPVPPAVPFVAVPHLAFPLIVGPSGVFDVLQQDTLEEVIQSVTVLLGTNLGDRVMVPSYGVADPTFSQPNPDAIAQAIARWEPRAEALVGVTEGANGTTSVTVQIALATAGS